MLVRQPCMLEIMLVAKWEIMWDEVLDEMRDD